MAVLYTPKDIQKVLQELRIKPIDGKVTTQEAARILSWRARSENKIEHDYNATAVRRHIQSGHLKAEPENVRKNMYRVENIFDLPIKPRQKSKPARLDPPTEDKIPNKSA